MEKVGETERRKKGTEVRRSSIDRNVQTTDAEMSASQLASWLVPPCIPLVVVPLAAAFGWMRNAWQVAGLLIVSVVLLITWQRAIFRLVPSLRNLASANLDAETWRLLTRWFIFLLLAPLAFVSYALVALLVFDSFTTWGTGPIAFLLFFWAAIVQFGMLNLVAHHVLLRRSQRE